jgi:hypothetical protein
LATVATGGRLQKRQLYSTNTLIEYAVHCFLAITSRDPQFRRDDIADRMLTMRVLRLTPFLPEAALLEQVKVHRNQIMTELAGYCQEVIRALKQASGRDLISDFRMADFAGFMLTLGAFAGVEDKVRNILQKLAEGQSDFLMEDDPLAELLHLFAEENPGREFSSASLSGLLTSLASAKNINLPFKISARRFGQYLRNNRRELERELVINLSEGRANQRFYSFEIKGDVEHD